MMGTDTKIEWAQHSMNFWIGCEKCSMGCDHCYMFAEQKSYGKDPAVIHRTTPGTWAKAKGWNKVAETATEPTFVFANSWSDFFHPAADMWRAGAWAMIREYSALTWLILTKRPENIAGRLPEDWGSGYPNVLLGVTIEHYQYLSRLGVLMGSPAAGYFVSVEPMLSIALFPADLFAGLSAVFAGGETGAGARPTHPNWVPLLAAMCNAYDVPFLWKSWGEWAPSQDFLGVSAQRDVVTIDGRTRVHPAVAKEMGGALMARVGRRNSGRSVSGKIYDGRLRLKEIAL